MRSQAAVAVAVSLIVLGSGLFALAVATPARAAAPAAGPAATDSVYTVTSYGASRSTFYTGYGSGDVYFVATDAADTSATVTINDGNASRDAISVPAFQTSVNLSLSPVNESYLWGIHYAIPLSLVNGGWWNITISGTNGGFYSYPFFVHTYYAAISTAAQAYLPGDSGSFVYQVAADANGAPYWATTVTVVADYFNATSAYVPLPGGTWHYSNTAWGNQTFSVPSDALTGGEIDFTIWANKTGTGINATEVAYAYVQVASLSAPSVLLGDCPASCSTSSFQDGAVAYVGVTAWILGSYYESRGSALTVAISFENGKTALTVPNAPTTLTTNDTGNVAFVFLATTSVFGTAASDSLNITVTDPRDSALKPVTTIVPFTVRSVSTVSPALQVTIDQQEYFSGDTIHATWELGGVNATASSGWTVAQWAAYEQSTGLLLAWGVINSTASTGTFSVVIPTTFGGYVDVYAWAYNASSTIYSSDVYALVSAPIILLNPSEQYYLGGDTITVTVTPEGSVLSGAMLYGSVLYSSGYQPWSGTITGGTISFTVPVTAAPSDIVVSAAAESATGGLLASRSVTLYLGTGFTVWAGVATTSNYEDGSYQPGQTISISYNLVPVGSTALPKIFTVEVYPGAAGYYGSGYGTLYAQVTSPSGSLSYTIPSGTPTGAQTFTVVVFSGSCSSTCEAYTTFGVNVQSSPSVLGMDLGAGSGLTVGWLILLIIVLVIAVLLVIMIRRVGRGGGGMGGRPEGVRPYSPSASPASSPPASTPAGSSDGGSPPPMPSPK